MKGRIAALCWHRCCRLPCHAMVFGSLLLLLARASSVDQADVNRSRAEAGRCAALAAKLRPPSSLENATHSGYCANAYGGTYGVRRGANAARRAAAPSTQACESDDAGLLLDLDAVSAERRSANLFESCSARCLACKRCRYLSFSAVAGRCLWFARCALSDLRPSRYGEQWQTTRISSLPLAEPLPPATFVPTASIAASSAASSPRSLRTGPLRLGLVTMHVDASAATAASATAGVGAHQYGCGVVGWCQVVADHMHPPRIHLK